jgi:cathepsin L
MTDSDVNPNQETSVADTIVAGAKKLVGATSCPNNYKSLASPVKDQGSCGACWCFSTAAAIESAYNRINNKVLDLSEEYILECINTYNASATPHSTCSGGILDYALEMLVNTGLPLESTYPYAGYSFGTGNSAPSTIGSCSSTSDFKQINFPSNNSKPLWYRYDNITSSSIETLLQRGTLVVAIYADSTFMSYSSGIFSCPVNFDTAFGNINHAVELVGMDCNGNYIIKNSWGTTWGESGYATISPTSDCALSAYVYSVLFEPSIKLVWLGMLLLLGLLL